MSNISQSQREQSDLISSKRVAIESVEIGKDILGSLAIQNEKLTETEDTLEANDHVLRKSMKTLRGMTWSGMIYNMFSGDSTPESETIKDSSSQVSTMAATATMTQSNGADHSTEFEQGDEDLREISTAVKELASIGVCIGETIDAQNSALSRITTKTELVHDQTLAVTLKASQMTRKYQRATDGFAGKFQFREKSTNMFLTVDAEGNLSLSLASERATFFDVHLRAGDIIGLQNCKTLKFVGSTWYGSIRCSGNVFGKQEECHVELDEGVESGIFVLCNNWGGGGWLRLTEDAGTYLLNSVTTGISDKTKMARFVTKAVKEQQEPKSVP